MLGPVPRPTTAHCVRIDSGQYAKEPHVLRVVCGTNTHIWGHVLPVHVHQSPAVQCHVLQIPERLQGEPARDYANLRAPFFTNILFLSSSTTNTNRPPLAPRVSNSIGRSGGALEPRADLRR